MNILYKKKIIVTEDVTSTRNISTKKIAKKALTSSFSYQETTIKSGCIQLLKTFNRNETSVLATQFKVIKNIIL